MLQKNPEISKKLHIRELQKEHTIPSEKVKLNSKLIKIKRAYFWSFTKKVYLVISFKKISLVRHS